MKSNILNTLMLFLICHSSLAQPTFEWAKSLGGTSNDISRSICTDYAGNTYSTGSFESTVDFDPGTGVLNITANGARDIFIQKLDANGNFLWTRTFGTSSSNGGYSVSTDMTGNVYVTGSFSGTVDFNPGSGVMNLTSNGSSDVFILKLDENGDFLWAKSFGGSGNDVGQSIITDDNANVYVTGSFNGIVDFDPGVGVSNYTSAACSDIYVEKLDGSGNFIWAKTSIGSNGSCNVGFSISVDAANNVYVSGQLVGTTDFEPGPGVTNLTSNGSADVFVWKLDNSGDFLWAKSVGSGSQDLCYSLTLDEAGNVNVAGYFSGTVDFDPGIGVSNVTSNGTRDIFILKLDENGNFIWVKSMGGTSSDSANSIITDLSSNIYVAGSFSGTVDFDPGAGTLNHTANGLTDVFILKLDENGDFIWVETFGGVNSDSGISIALDLNGAIYTTGFFKETVDFDPGTGITEFTSNGNFDSFTLKLSECIPTTSSTSHTACESYTWNGTSYTVTGIYTFSTTNAAGCDSTATLNLTIEDVTSPVADVTSLSNITSECSVTSLTPPTATDNCVGTVTGTTPASLPITASTTITWTYDDGNGNTSTQTQDVVIDDITAPVADNATLTTLTAQCEITSITPPTATDNCVGTVTGTHNTTLPITSTTTITWTYDDGNGNTSTQTQEVTIDDVTAPVADNATLTTLTAQCQITSLTPPTATDNCIGTVTGTHNTTLPITSTTTITWTYDDGNGNTSTQTQEVTIDDVTAPVADNATLTTLTAQCQITSLTPPTATDNCIGTVTGTHNATLPITSTTTITWTYDDGNGNTSTQTQEVSIDDVTAPVTDAASLTDLTDECEITSLTIPTATDNCVGTVTGTHNTTLPITSTSTIIWTYDDGNGNTSTQTQEVIITPIDNSVSDVDDITLSANASGYLYQWIDCDDNNSPIVGETNQTFEATTNGSYAVEISNGSCMVTSNCVVINQVGIGVNGISELITVYPNPTTGLVHLKSQQQIQSIELIDGLGRIVNSYSGNTKEFEIEGSPGVYSLLIVTDNLKISRIRIIKK